MAIFSYPINPPQVQYISNAKRTSFNDVDAKQLTNFLISQIPSRLNIATTEQSDKLKQSAKNTTRRSITDTTTVPAKPGETQMYYTTEFGYVPLPKTLDGLKLLLADEAVTFYDHAPDLANFYYAIYYQFGEAVLKQIADAHLLPSAVSGRRYHDNVFGTPDRVFVGANGQTTYFAPGMPNVEGDKPAQEVVHYPNY